MKYLEVCIDQNLTWNVHIGLIDIFPKTLLPALAS